MHMIDGAILVEEDPEQVIPPNSRKVFVAVDELGLRIGETHPNAKLTDAEVDQIRDLREIARWGYSDLAAAYGVPKSTIHMICTYKRRASTIARWKVLLLLTPISLTNTLEA